MATATKGFRIDTLELQGFGSYKNLTVVDFSMFKEVAIVGHNGSGKSTLLEAILFALYGQTRQKTLDLAIGLGQSQAKVILTFFLGEDKYRLSRIRSKNRSILTLEEEAEYGYKDITSSTIADTQKTIDAIVGVSFGSMVSTAFMRQGEADRFASATPSEKKDILIEILEMDFFENVAVNSRKKENELSSSISNIESKMEIYRRSLSVLSDKEIALDEVGNSLNEDQARLDDLNVSIEDARSKIERLRQKESVTRSIEATKSQIAQINRSNAEAANNHRDLVESRKEVLRGKEIELDSYSYLPNEPLDTSSLVDKKETLATGMKGDREAKTSLAELLRAVKFTISEMDKRTKNLEKAKSALAEVGTLDRSLSDLEAEMEEVTSLVGIKESQISKNGSELASLVEIGRSISATYEKLSNRKWEVDNAKCVACGQPIEISDSERGSIEADLLEASSALATNRRSVEGLEKKIDLLRKEVSSDREVLASVNLLKLEATKHESGLKALAREVSYAEDQVAEIDSSYLREESEVISLEENLRALEDKIAFLEEELAQLDREILRAYETNKKISEKDNLAKELSSLDQEIARLEANAPKKVLTDGLVAELDRLADLLEELGVEDEVIDMERLESQHRYYSDRINKNQAIAIRIEKEIEMAQADIAQLAELEKEKMSYEEMLFVYKFISNGASKTGIQSYLLSIILPELEAVVNSYLERMTQGQISLSFITEREGKGKDGAISTLEILANTPSGERPYATFSGAERFIMDISMRMALARLLATRNGRTLRFFVIDEGWGSLDEEHTQSLLEILRSISDDFDLIMTVTHVEKVAEAFPVRFVVEKNLSTGSMVEAHF